MTMRARVVARPDLGKVQVAVFDDDENSSAFHDVLLDPAGAAEFAEAAQEAAALLAARTSAEHSRLYDRGRAGR